MKGRCQKMGQNKSIIISTIICLLLVLSIVIIIIKANAKQHQGWHKIVNCSKINRKFYLQDANP